ncbi:AglZ/HisF2 family acetamidino modification protein [beta proteobacterium MWH-UniP1]
MLKHRVIPALLLKSNGLVKTVKFKDPKYVGDPINAIRIFNEKEVDELMVLDINASRENREPNYELIEQFAGECFMPLAYGGGIKKIEQARKLFSLGVEKICLQTAAYEDPHLIRVLVSEFGSQSVMVSVDVKRDFFGRAKVYIASLGKTVAVGFQEVISRFVEAGAGEILLNAVDKDGTLSGPDLGLIQQASQNLRIPLIALGGISSLADIKAAIEAGASAVAAGAFFVYHGTHRAVLITYPEYKELEELFAYKQVRN